MERRYKSRKLQRMVRGYKGLRQFIPLGETEIRARVKNGTFPKPLVLGSRSIAWLESDLVAEQQRLVDELKQAK